MIDAGNGGSIINISSAAGIKAVPGCGHYCATKFGVVALTNSLAVELGEFGIRVNSVHPYGTDTPMGNDTAMYQMFADHQTYIHSFSPGALPTDSLAAPDLVSDIVLWLAGDELVVGDRRPDPRGQGLPEDLAPKPQNRVEMEFPVANPAGWRQGIPFRRPGLKLERVTVRA